jgi:hypothetical protein
MSLTAVSAATQILASALKGLDSLREQSKTSKDAALKEGISKLYDTFLDLKAAVIRVEEENSGLKRALAEATGKPKPEVRTVGLANYYYVGNEGPFCVPCYAVNNERLVPLMPPRQDSGGIYRRCEACGKNFWEKPIDDAPAFGIASGPPGPNGWMR